MNMYFRLYVHKKKYCDRSDIPNWVSCAKVSRSTYLNMGPTLTVADVALLGEKYPFY